MDWDRVTKINSIVSEGCAFAHCDRDMKQEDPFVRESLIANATHPFISGICPYPSQNLVFCHSVVCYPMALFNSIKKMQMPTIRRSNAKYTLLDSVKSRATKFNLLMITAIGLTIAVIVVLVAVLAKRHQTTRPNVSLFNLPSSVTPPKGTNLNLVYLGYGMCFQI